ncbi:MAG: hypothetical protein ACFB6R_05495 [Alphaproteobacteria bacterium]
METVSNGQPEPKVLLLSVRGVVHWLAATAFYELEDLAHDWMDADLCAPPPGRDNLRGKIAAGMNTVIPAPSLISPVLSPALGGNALKREYDFLFAILPTPREAFVVSSVPNLRARCAKMACYIPEVWAHSLTRQAYLAGPLRQFDHIFVSTRHSMDVVTRLTGVPCTFLPFGVDAEKFSPFPFFPDRHIDVLSIGRRRPEDHAALLKAMDDTGIYYSYDTFQRAKFRNAQDHRTHYANTAKRAKYFIANVANIDDPKKLNDGLEIGHRFYEGAAAGTIMLGACPQDNPVLNEDFDWPDFVIRTNTTDKDIIALMADLDTQPERLDAARKANVANSLLRHDYVYRWEHILNVMGVPASQKMRARQTRLREMATTLNANSAVPSERIEQPEGRPGISRA